MPRILRKLTIGEISAVDKPAQAHAKSVIMKRADDDGAKIVELAKRSVNEGTYGLTKRDFETEIRKRADQQFEGTPGLSPQQRFARFIATPDGNVLLKASLLAGQVEAFRAQNAQVK